MVLSTPLDSNSPFPASMILMNMEELVIYSIQHMSAPVYIDGYIFIGGTQHCLLALTPCRKASDCIDQSDWGYVCHKHVDFAYECRLGKSL